MLFELFSPGNRIKKIKIKRIGENPGETLISGAKEREPL
jgi:hypothetical protein